MRELMRLVPYLLQLSRGLKMPRATFVAVIATGLASGLAMTAMIAVINARISGSGTQTEMLAWAFLALVLVRPLLRFLAQFLVLNMTEHSFLVLRVDLCRRILGVPMRHLEKLGKPRLMAGIVNDVGIIVQAVVQLPMLFMYLSVVAGLMTYLGLMYWPLLPVLLVFTFFGLATMRWSLKRAVAKIAEGREYYDRIFHYFRGVTEGTKELKMHWRRRQEFLADLEVTARKHRSAMRMSDIILAATWSWSEMLFFAAVGMLLFVLPEFVTLDPAVMVGYVITVLMLQTPLEGVNRGLQVLSQAQVALKKLQELTDILVDRSTEEGVTYPVLPGAGWSTVELRGATHTYHREKDDGSFTLGPVDLTLRPGELVFLVGGNGSGKTTLAKLLLGIYAPERGGVYLDGEEIDDSNRNRYRQHFSAVFSDFFLFDTLLGIDPESLDDRAREYLALLHLEHKVTVKDGALSTIDLSQGQRKRLALLIAYLEDRPIYLFDEWAADQDPQFKEVFYLKLLPELKARGKTLVVISHDEHYYRVADRIVKMTDGAVEFDGPARDFVLRPKALAPKVFQLPETIAPA